MTLFGHTFRLAAAWMAISVAWVVPAAAGDWSLKTSLSETLSANDNLGFVADPDGNVIGTNSRLGLDLVRKSHIDEFLLNGSLGYQTYFGDYGDIPGDRLLPSLRTSYLRRGKTTDVSFGASYILTPASTDTGLEIADDAQSGDRQTYSVNTSVVHKINARNDVTLAARASKTDFINGGAADTPFTTLGSTLTWKRQETKRVDFTLSSSLDWYDYDDALNRQRLYYVLRGGTQARLSKRLTINAGLGGTLSDTSHDVLFPPPERDGNTSVGTLADLGFSYLLKTGTITGGLSYGLTPDDNGDFQNNLSFNAALTHRINDLMDFRLGGQYVRSDSDVNGNLANSTFSISPSLSYTLARDWLLNASYQFAWKDYEAGNAYQNAVYLTLTRNYVLMP